MTMPLDTTTPESMGIRRDSFPPKGHQGYCPILDGKILGRFKFYDTAKTHSAYIMRYRDAVKRKLVEKEEPQ